MAELFSHCRLIDYFTVFDIEIIKFIENWDLNYISEEDKDCLPLKIKYKYQVQHIFPKKVYKGIYELNLESIFQWLSTEYIFLKKPPNRYITLIFTNRKQNNLYKLNIYSRRQALLRFLPKSIQRNRPKPSNLRRNQNC